MTTPSDPVMAEAAGRELPGVRLISTLRADRRAVPPAQADTRERLVAMTDAALLELWEGVLASYGLDSVAGVALVALGSLGRKDCGPESDLDLLLLHDERAHRELPEGISGLADALWYPIWDSHVELDHSVRSIEECRAVAANDLSAAFALLDIRCIAGDAELVERASAVFYADWRKFARLKFPEIERFQDERVDRFGELAYQIEGDLKESAGGLRDVIVLRAIVATWLAERPSIDYVPAYEFVLSVRDALASVTRRHGHVLSIRLHDEVARILGIEGEDPADELLARVSRSARIIRGAYEDTAARARRNLAPVRARPHFSRTRRHAPVFEAVAPGVVRVSGELALASDNASRDPRLVLTLAESSARLETPIRQATLMSLKELDALGPLREGPWPAWARQLMEKTLASGKRQIAVWEQLDLEDFITDLIPEWGSVRNLPQRSIIHRHTVDRHHIEAVSRIPRIEALGGATLDDLTPGRRSALLLATFLHDIGKRTGQPGHSERGMTIAGQIVARMGYDDTTQRDVETLVRNHLLLGDLATSADPDDILTQERIAAAVGDRELLTCLHILTQADASSCKPEAWDSWKAILVADLVRGAFEVMS